MLDTNNYYIMSNFIFKDFIKKLLVLIKLKISLNTLLKMAMI